MVQLRFYFLMVSVLVHLKHPSMRYRTFYHFWLFQISPFHNFIYLPKILTIYSAPFLWKFSPHPPKTRHFSPDFLPTLHPHFHFPPFPPLSQSFPPHTWHFLLFFYFTQITTYPSPNTPPIPRYPRFIDFSVFHPLFTKSSFWGMSSQLPPECAQICVK